MNEPDAPPIDFCFDFISHNAYLAWHAVTGIAAAHGRTLRAVPTLFAGFLKAYGQLGPAEIEPKLRWMNRNNLRKAALLGIPYDAPLRHPFHPLLLLRVAAQDLPEDTRCSVTDTLLRGVWAERLDPGDERAVAACMDRAGLDGEALVAGAASQGAKDALRANGEAAIARGAFGVPTMLVGEEVFWGYDDLPMLERHLAGKDPLDGVDVESHEHAWTQARIAGEHRS